MFSPPPSLPPSSVVWVDSALDASHSGRGHSRELTHTLRGAAGASSSRVSFAKVHQPVVWWEMQRATYSPLTSPASSLARQ